MPLDPNVAVLLDALYLADEANETLTYFFPELQAVLSEEVMGRLQKTASLLNNVEDLIQRHLGGPDRVVQLEHEREVVKVGKEE